MARRFPDGRRGRLQGASDPRQSRAQRSRHDCNPFASELELSARLYRAPGRPGGIMRFRLLVVGLVCGLVPDPVAADQICDRLLAMGLIEAARWMLCGSSRP